MSVLKCKEGFGTGLGLLFALGSMESWANCTPVTSGGVTYSFSVPTLSIPRDTPNGTEVYRSNQISLGESAAINCSGDTLSGLIGGPGVYAGDGVPTRIADSGLGFMLYVDGGNVRRYSGGFRYYGTGTFDRNRQVSIRLFKIGEVSTARAGSIGSVFIYPNTAYYIALSNDIQPVVSSCTTPSITVPLGKQFSNKFKGVGSTIGEKAFSIQLNNCPAGINSISYRLDPVNSALDAVNGILALDPGGATGVGIKITDDNNAAVGLGRARAFLKNVAEGSYSIPLKAAYYKTSDTVVGGAANASMQFTITYQ